MHSVVGTAANVADVTQVDKLLHGEEMWCVPMRATPGCRSLPKHAGREVTFKIAARCSTYKQLSKRSVL